MIKITVFTATYNRAHRLRDLYASLKAQNYDSFEWLVVDDGSEDNTEALMKEWEMEAVFPIHFVKQRNSGKHIAINHGMQMAQGEFFFIVDSDDVLRNNVLKRLEVRFRQIGKENNSLLAGIAGLSETRNGHVIGTPFPAHYENEFTSFLDWKKNGVVGDKAEVFYLPTLKKYPFPQERDEKFCSEAIVWHRMAYDGYKLFCVNEIFKTCEYLEDGLSANIETHMKKSPQSTLLYFKEWFSFIKSDIWWGMKVASWYILYARFFKMRDHEIKQELGISGWYFYFASALAKVRKIKGQFR